MESEAPPSDSPESDASESDSTESLAESSTPDVELSTDPIELEGSNLQPVVLESANDLPDGQLDTIAHPQSDEAPSPEPSGSDDGPETA